MVSAVNIECPNDRSSVAQSFLKRDRIMSFSGENAAHCHLNQILIELDNK
jgi:hypothetical protein